MVSQFYVTEAENEYVIRANSAIMKCKIPSFVSEFVQVDQWVADDGTIYTPGQEEYGMRPVDADVVCVVVCGATSSPFSFFPVILISHPQTSSHTFFVSRQSDNCRLQFATHDEFQLLLSEYYCSIGQPCATRKNPRRSVFKLRDKHIKDGYEDKISKRVLSLTISVAKNMMVLQNLNRLSGLCSSSSVRQNKTKFIKIYHDICSEKNRALQWFSNSTRRGSSTSSSYAEIRQPWSASYPALWRIL